MKIFITRSIPDEAEIFLRKKNYEVKTYRKDKPIPRREFFREAENADGLITLLTEQVDREFIDSLKKCRIIANYAVGYNNIDVKYARRKNIVVTNTPGVLTEATADLTASLILACSRNIVQGHAFMQSRKFEGWKPKLLLGIELKGKTLGILGAGRIGYGTALRLKSFGTRIIYFDKARNKEFEKELSAKKVSLKYLMKSADIISIHLPLTAQTHHLLNKEKLNLMKPTAVLVNTARGEIVEEKELIKMLKLKKIFSAGFDVYDGEPEVNPELYRLENVVLLPHIGSATFEARKSMALLAAKNVDAVLSGRKPLTPVY